MVLLLKSAKIVDAKSPFHLQQKDILIDNGIIKKIENHLDIEADEIIILENLHVSIGWFDPSVSFGEPGYEERETLKNGMDTAMKSGFTQVALNSNTHPVIDNSSLIQYIKTKSENHIVEMLPTGALTEKSDGVHMAELFDMHSHGVVAFGDYKSSIRDANLLKIALQYTKTFNGLVQLCPIDKDLCKNIQMHEGAVSTTLGLKALPRMAEIIQLKRDLEIVKYTDAKVHFSCISTAESVELIKNAKAEGLNVSCSVALHHLYYTDKNLESFDTKFKVFPPLREIVDQKALVEGLIDGTIDMVTTDHQPLNVELKRTEFEHAAFGSIGLESAFGILNKIMGLENSINALTKGKTRFKQADHKIDIDQAAVLSLFNPEETWIFTEKDILSKSKNAIFLDERLLGRAYGIINKGSYYVSKH